MTLRIQSLFPRRLLDIASARVAADGGPPDIAWLSLVRLPDLTPCVVQIHLNKSLKFRGLQIAGTADMHEH